MCSWCWGYQPTLARIEAQFLARGLRFTKVLGGLAPDSDQAMPSDMQQAIEGYWRIINTKLGTTFNHDFWRLNTPRRSTYPACRAILLARKHGLENEMNAAIQQAYYLEARNPSDTEVLADLARKLDLDASTFENALHSEATQLELIDELKFARAIDGNSFPSWILVQDNVCTTLDLDYKDPQHLLDQAQNALNLA